MICKTFFAALTLACSLLSFLLPPAFAESALFYDGTVGTAGVGMILYVNKSLDDLLSPGPVSGTYFYDKYLKDIKIDGETDGKRNIVLNEYDAAGKKSATMTCSLPETDPGGVGTTSLKGEVLTGTWLSADGKTSLPVSFRLSSSTVASHNSGIYGVAGVTDSQLFEQKVQRFRRAVLANDRKTVASMIRYPVLATAKGKQRKIQNASEFLDVYDSIFTPKYVGLIKNAVPHNMFVRYDGIMLGSSGEVWFDASGKVKTLNN